MPDQIETVKRWTMKGIGWIKTAKGAGMAGVQATATGLFIALGFGETASLALGAAVSTAVTAARQFVKSYKIVKTSI